MRTAILIILFVSSLCFGTSEVFAQCSCLPSLKNLTAHKEFKLADVVFVGEVVKIKRTVRDKKTDRYTEIVTFKVKSTWKQNLEEFVIITNEISGCINGFGEKEEWLVYAYKEQNIKFHTRCCCSRTKPLSKADEDLKEFEVKGEKLTTVVKKQNRK